MAKKKKPATEAQLPKLPPEVESLLDVLLAVRLRRAFTTVSVPAKGAQQPGREGSAAVHPEQKTPGET